MREQWKETEVKSRVRDESFHSLYKGYIEEDREKRHVLQPILDSKAKNEDSSMNQIQEKKKSLQLKMTKYVF
jgi:hypothetical protein